MTTPRHLFVDRLSIMSLWPVLRRGHGAHTVWTFDGASRVGLACLRLAQWLRLTRASVRRVEAHVGMIHHSDGTSVYPDVCKQVRDLTERIRREHLANHPLIRALKGMWEPARVEFHFARQTEREIKRELLRIALTGWLLDEPLRCSRREGLLLIRQGRWTDAVRRQAQACGLPLASYWAVEGLGHQAQRVWRIAQEATRKGFRRLWKRTPDRQQTVDETPQPRTEPFNRTIAVQYGHGRLDLDSSRRTELFWLLHDHKPAAEILLYNYVGEQPMSEQNRQALAARGVHVIGRGPGAIAWAPTRRVLVFAMRATWKIVVGVWSCLRRRRRVALRDLLTVLELAWSSAYWQDFYASHRVAVSVANPHAHVGQILGLDAAGGVAVAYQHSASNLIFPALALSSGEHVQAVWSPRFEASVWRSLHSPTRAYVLTGAIMDGRWADRSDVRQRVGAARRRLEQAGARFVIAFFDENAADQWELPAPIREAVADYEFLLNWLRQDPTLGVIIKPKKSSPILMQRLGPIASRLQEALETGRCLLMGSETLFSDVFPAEAALMADVSIGKLVGTTAALEARLGGSKAVLIDTEAFRQHPIHVWGRDRVVFDTWSALRATVEAFRRSPAEAAEFGEWGQALRAFDPWCDGQGARRLAQLVTRLHRAVEGGLTPGQAVATVVRAESDATSVERDAIGLEVAVR